MDNTTLSNRAEELAKDLRQHVNCYLTTGWMRRSDGLEIFVIYYDYRYMLPDRVVPSDWYGCPVVVQEIVPPGIDRSDILPEMPW